jgi:hypothetical protein
MRSRSQFAAALCGFFVLGAFAVVPAFAQDGTVTGVVTQARTGQPLPGALVQLDGTDLGGLTRDDGRFMIPGVPVGSYTLRVRIIGHTE